MRIAITGASGRIGNLLVKELLEEGHEVSVLAHRATKFFQGLPVNVVRGSILEPADLDHLVRGCEVVYHLAAVISIFSGMNERLRRVNIDGTLNVLQAARRQKVRRVIYFSTVHAFLEEGPDTFFDETRPLALKAGMAYSRTKAEALDFALQFPKKNNLEVVALCPTGVLGPYDPEPSLSGQMLIDFYRGRIPALAPGGFDWVDVRDVVNAALAAIREGRSGEAYLLSGTYASVSDLAGIVHRLTGKPVPGMTVPYYLLRIIAPLAETFSRIAGISPRFTRDSVVTLRKGSRFVSSEKARRELGFRSRPLEETIAAAYVWFDQNNYL